MLSWTYIFMYILLQIFLNMILSFKTSYNVIFVIFSVLITYCSDVNLQLWVTSLEWAILTLMWIFFYVILRQQVGQANTSIYVSSDVFLLSGFGYFYSPYINFNIIDWIMYTGVSLNLGHSACYSVGINRATLSKEAPKPLSQSSKTTMDPDFRLLIPDLHS